MWEQWGVEILAFPLTWHIAYTTACCYRTSRDGRQLKAHDFYALSWKLARLSENALRGFFDHLSSL